MHGFDDDRAAPANQQDTTGSTVAKHNSRVFGQHFQRRRLGDRGYGDIHGHVAHWVDVQQPDVGGACAGVHGLGPDDHVHGHAGNRGPQGRRRVVYSVNVAAGASGTLVNSVLLTARGGDVRTPANDAATPSAGSSTQGSDKLSAKAAQSVTVPVAAVTESGTVGGRRGVDCNRERAQ